MSMKCGGTRSVEITDEIRALANQVRPLIEDTLGKEFDDFSVEEVKVQVVAGTNYFFSLKVGENDYVHAKIFKALPHVGSTLTCHTVLTDKTSDDILEYF